MYQWKRERGSKRNCCLNILFFCRLHASYGFHLKLSSKGPRFHLLLEPFGSFPTPCTTRWVQRKKKLRCFILLTDVIHAQKYFFSFTPAKCSPGTFSSICLLVKVVDSMYKESKPPPSPHMCALKHKCLHTLNNFFFFFYIGRLCKRQGEMGRGEEGG